MIIKYFVSFSLQNDFTGISHDPQSSGATWAEGLMNSSQITRADYDRAGTRPSHSRTAVILGPFSSSSPREFHLPTMCCPQASY